MKGFNRKLEREGMHDGTLGTGAGRALRPVGTACSCCLLANVAMTVLCLYLACTFKFEG